MHKYKLFSLLLLFTSAAFCQNNFTFTPQRPKPGDIITFSYEPLNESASTNKKVEAVYYTLNAKGLNAADDIVLTKNGNKYTGSFKTDTSSSLAFLGFSVNDKFDNNDNKGYYVQLYEGDKVKRSSWYNLSLFYQSYGREVGVERDVEQALNAMANEMQLYPEDKSKNINSYARLLNAAKKTEAASYINKEIESYQSLLQKEDDYTRLEDLYTIAKMPEKAKAIAEEKKQKFPDGRWNKNNMMNEIFREQDPEKVKTAVNILLVKAKENPSWELDNNTAKMLKSQAAFSYANKKDWDGFKAALKEADLSNDQLASLYNNAAWELQKTSTHLKDAEEWSRFAVEYAKKEIANPSVPKPANVTTKQWAKNKKYGYAMFADTYAMVLYKLGDYKKGYTYAKEAAIDVYEGKNASYNHTYALLAENALPARQARKEIESFIKNGKVSNETKEALKRIYIKENGSDKDYDAYLAKLNKASLEQALEDLRKSMVNEAAPAFTLYDLDGNKISSNDLKGKVVVVDFWATWCGPCKASFPAMQKAVDKYKEDPNVKFVFVDTWENVENKKKNASDFIAKNNYTFHVLMDEESKMVEQFKVQGIPTKFVLDQNGNIRFKAIGFDGSDDKLITEVSAMIELATGASKKTL